MFSFRKPKLRVTLLGVLALVVAVSLHYQLKANDLHKTIIPKQTTYYTPGQKDNCKWIMLVKK